MDAFAEVTKLKEPEGVYTIFIVFLSGLGLKFDTPSSRRRVHVSVTQN